MKKVMSVLIIFMIILSSFSCIIASAENEGAYTDNIKWIFDPTTGTLTVYGEGDMKFKNGAYTWDNNYNNITNVIINDGITSISSASFNICENIISAYIPKTISKISENAFKNCSKLKDIYYAGTKAEWNNIDIEESGNNFLINARIQYLEEPHVCVFGDWEVITLPTCVATGMKIRKCSCGNEETELISATNIHNYEWIIKQEATCIEDGKKVERCTVCGNVGNSIIIDKIGHKMSEWVISTEATCENEGKRVQKCLNCGVILNQDSIDKLSHNFGDWNVSVKPTEKEYGIESRTCKSCKLVETRRIDKLPSSDVDNILLGDVNGDNTVKATDARLVLQVVAGLKSYNDIIYSNADINGDEKITATDARIILQIVAGIYNN